MKKNKRRRRRKNTCDGLLFKCDHPEMVFSSSPTVCLISFFFFCLFLFQRAGLLKIKKRRGGPRLPGELRQQLQAAQRRAREIKTHPVSLSLAKCQCVNQEMRRIMQDISLATAWVSFLHVFRFFSFSLVYCPCAAKRPKHSGEKTPK